MFIIYSDYFRFLYLVELIVRRKLKIECHLCTGCVVDNFLEALLCCIVVVSCAMNDLLS
jgi:hypothetical protein